MDINDKKLFIYKNINNIKNHNDIINYIESNDIKYSINDNGFFVNISYLKEEQLDFIYNIILYCMKNNDDNQLFIDKREEILNLGKNNNKNTVKIIQNIPLDLFTQEEQSIILQSKKFKI